MDFYSTCARILDAVQTADKPPSLKAVCAHEARQSSPSRCYAILCETLKYLPVLERLLKSVDLLKHEAQALQRKNASSARSLAVLLVHDLLFSKRGITLPKEHKIRVAVERYAIRLKANLQREKIRAGVQTDQGLQVAIDQYMAMDIKGKGRQKQSDGQVDPDNLDGKIRWLRVNENRWTVEQATEWLLKNGYDEVTTLSEAVTTKGHCFFLDEHVPNLFAFANGMMNLPKFKPYLDGRLIAQDKASCLPAYLLLHDLVPSTSEPVTVIDATSAPGNKTSYASATLMRAGSGRVIAFERNENRFKTLRQMLSRAGCRNVQAWHADFLECDPTIEPFSEATHILVDPSCSGSGIHADFGTNSIPADALQARLRPLSQFQRYILAAALRFSKARKVVYSTCSVHREENEDVVMSVLDMPDFQDWTVDTRDKVLPEWPLRGKNEGYEDRDPALFEGMIRCERRLGTHGFFVAVLVRKDAPSTSIAELEEIVRPAPEPATGATMRAVSPQVDSKTHPNKSARRDKSQKQRSKPAKPQPNGGISLLRLATIDRRRRAKLSALRAVEKLRHKRKVTSV